MIAPVKKSVNHSTTVASMRETGRGNNNFKTTTHLRSDTTLGSEFAFIILVLVIAFFAVTNFFGSNVELTFFFLLVLRLSLHALYYAKNEERDQ